MLDYTTDPSLCPRVTLLEQGPRYATDEITAAIPPKAPPNKTSKATDGGAPSGGWDETDPKVTEAIEHFKICEPDLWGGNWKDHQDPLTGQKPFASQSEADYDFVVVYDGRTSSSTLLSDGDLSGDLSDLTTLEYSGTQDSLMVEFTSDESLSDGGFEAMYRCTK